MTTETPAQAPTVAIGYTQAPTYTWYYDQAETTPELQWPQSVQVFDQMRRTDAQVTSVLRAVTLPVRRTPWRVDPNGARPEVVQFVADDLGLPVAGENEVRTPLRSKGRFSWSEHLRLALLMLPFGHAYFEQLYRVDGDGSRAHLGKLEYRPPTTIERIEVASDGGLVYVKQYWTATNSDPKPIPVDRLVAYINEREGGNWLGTSILRAAYKNWLLKDRLLRVQAQTIERNGMGIPDYEAAETETSLAAGLALATSLRAGEAAGISRPSGSKMKLMGVEGTLPDAEPAVRYHDEQIARAVLAHFLNLGTQTGSWALGSTFADFFTLSLQTLAQQIADTTTRHVIEDLVDVNWGPDEPAPRLCFDEIGSRQAATAEALKSLVDAGILHPDEPLEGATRQFYGLPPADPATATPAPGQPQGETVPPPTQTGEYSVAAKRGPAMPRRRAETRRRGKRSVRANYDPAWPRDEQGQWSGLGGLAGKALETLVDNFGEVLESHSWGDHGGDAAGDDVRGWVTLHADGTGVVSLKGEDGDAETVLTTDDLLGGSSALPSLVDALRSASRAADSDDDFTDYEGDPDSPTWQVTADPQDGTVAVDLNGGQHGWVAGSDSMAELADQLEDFETYHDRWDDGEYDNAPVAASDAASWIAAAAGIDTHPGGEQLKHYWVFGEGAALWATWYELRDHLAKYLTGKKLARTVSAWYKLRYGHMPPHHNAVHASALAGSAEALAAYAEEFGEADGDDEDGEWELAIDALSAALDELSGRVEAAFNPDLHPRNPKGAAGGGRFRSTVDRLKDALTEHKKSGGKSGDPFEGFDREQLRRAAVKQGIKLDRKEDRDSIVKKLTDHLGGGDGPGVQKAPEVKAPKKPRAPRRSAEPASSFDVKHAATGLAALDAAPSRTRIMFEAHLTPQKRREFHDKLAGLSDEQVRKLGGPGLRATLGDEEHVSGEEISRINAAVADYMETGYLGVNRTLAAARGGELDADVPAEIRHRISAIDRLLQISHMDSDAILFRGTRFEGDPPAELSYAGFSSATADERIARDFARGEFMGTETGSAGMSGAPTVMEIRVPKGTPAAQLSDYMTAAEVLLSRDQAMRLVEDQGVRDGVRRVVYEVVPAGSVSDGT